MWLNSIKKKSDPSNNTASQYQRNIQHEHLSKASIKQAQATSQFNEAVTEMTEISKSSYHSAKNMEKLTAIIAVMTMTSLVISLMGLTIAATQKVDQESSGFTVFLAWGIGFLMAWFGFLLIIILLERGEYIPQNPHLSHIKRYKKYCWSRLKVSLGIYGSFYILGVIFGILSIIALISKDYEKVISEIMNNYWFIIPTIYLIILSITVIIFGIKKGYYPHFVYFVGIISSTSMASIMGEYFCNSWVLPYLGVVVLLIGWIAVCLMSVYYLTKIITLFVDGKYTLDDWYEYKSDKTHTGIVVIMDQHHYGYLVDDGVKRLAKHFMNNLMQPYRVYFCFKKEQLINILEKDAVNDIVIFGYLTDNCGNPIHYGMDYSNSGLVDSKFHGKTFDQILYSKKKVKSLIHAWEKEPDSLED